MLRSASRRLVRAAAEKEGGTIIDRIIGTLRLPALVGTIRLGGTKVVGRGGPSRGDTIFVAGATGRLGSRVVFELLRMGFRVRAGVREVTEVQVTLRRCKLINQTATA